MTIVIGIFYNKFEIENHVKANFLLFLLNIPTLYTHHIKQNISSPQGSIQDGIEC